MKAFLILGACALLAGCAGGNQDDLQAWMAGQAKNLRGQVKPTPELKPFPVVAYAGAQGDDPFRAARMEPDRTASSGALGPDMDRRREPLESYPLESLHMVGVLMQGVTIHALISVNNALHQVKVGNYMGQNFGVVTSITEHEVVLRELVEDAYGDWVERTSTLTLQERQEAGK